jgi:6-methylsalicylate decarboxylase
MMKSINVTKSILSVSTPGVHLKQGDHALARKLAKVVNDYAADLKRRRPDQFGFFASLPLADVEGCMEEIPRALDELNADGFVVLTNFHGTYLGDKVYDKIFEELNRRKAVVFIHPTTPCLSSGTAATPLPQFPRPMFEFLFDTARAAINLFLSGTVQRCPNITFLLSHCGGALPVMINRFASAAPLMKLPAPASEISKEMVKQKLNSQFYFDTAGWSFPEQITGLLQHVSIDRILYGSDFPFTWLSIVEDLSKEHDEHLPKVFDREEDISKLCNRNATKLFGQKAQL